MVDLDDLLGAVRAGAHAGGLLAALGVLGWAFGRPFLFPSLGPSAYVFAVAPTAAESRADRVVGGHLIGVVAGLVAYHLFASGSRRARRPPSPAPPPG